MNILEISGLQVEFDGNYILKDLDIKIKKGLLTAVVGRSGAGKSTLLKVMNRSVRFTGTYLYMGETVEKYSILEFRKKAVMVDQVAVAFPGNIRDNLTIGCKYWKMNCEDEQVLNLLKMVDLDISLEKDASELSVGQLQRVHLARAIALKPEILLLDESTSALDAISKETVERIMRELVQAGTTIVIVTHDLKQAERIADHCILLEQGKKLLDAPHDQFFKDVEDETDAEILRDLLEVE